MYNITFLTEQEARNYPLLPNSKMLFMDPDNQVFYIKTSDPTTFKIYSFTEVIPPAPPKYATIDDLASLKNDILAAITSTSQSALIQQHQEVINNESNK